MGLEWKAGSAAGREGPAGEPSGPEWGFVPPVTTLWLCHPGERFRDSNHQTKKHRNRASLKTILASEKRSKLTMK